MKAYSLNKVTDLSQNTNPLTRVSLDIPIPTANELLIRVTHCGICHTELDEIEGRTISRLPVVPGHQVIGIVEEIGNLTSRFIPGDRVGVGWIWSACGVCEYCVSGNENLCSSFIATGRDVNGGYAEYMIARENFSYHIPGIFSNEEAAPLLCAGAIGYRSLNLCRLRNGDALGLTGFGASAHLVLKLAKYTCPDSKIFVFARSREEQEYAISLGADWAGNIESTSPERLAAIIDTTPVWKPVVESLKNLLPGGRMIINAIRKENIDLNSLLSIDYVRDIWMEKEIKSVANVCSTDVSEFLNLAAEMNIKPEIQLYPFDSANEALMDLRNKKIMGAKVLQIS